jgi:hypothetical protein
LELEKSEQDHIRNSQSGDSIKKVDNRSGGVYFEGSASVHIRGDVVGGDQKK